MVFNQTSSARGPQSRWKVEHKILAAFAIGFLAVVLLGFGTYYNARTLLDRNQWVQHTYLVLSSLDDVQSGTEQFQSATRGFLLSGKDDYLQVYEAGLHTVRESVDSVRKLTVDNPTQQTNVGALDSVINRAIASTQAEIKARREDGSNAIQSFGLRDKEIMDQVRLRLAGMRAHENGLLESRDAAAHASAKETLITLGVLLLVAVILVACFFLVIRHDLAARRRAEQAVRESENKIRGVMDSTPDALLIADAEGRIQMTNAQAEQLFGFKRETFRGRNLTDLLVARAEPQGDAEEINPVRLAQDKAFQGFRELASHFDGVRHDGTVFPIDLSTRTVQLGEEKLVISAVRDRTAQEHAEEAIRKFSLDLARSNAELERFAYVASHDLQEPLRMVSSYTQLLSRRYKGKLDANADEFIAYAVDGANRMQKLINDLLALSRVGTQARPSEPVETGITIARVCSDLKLALEAAEATVNYPPDLPTVMADGVQIGQLFQNLIGNALKFRGKTPPQINVSVQSEEGSGLWRFAFKDNGIGIEPQYFERIFIIFQRLHNKEDYPGTGIGLAICKKIVERHGGNLWVESTVGEGSTFFFTLPGVS